MQACAGCGLRTGRRHNCFLLPSLKACAVLSSRMPSGQAQKEFSINQAMTLIDTFMQGRVEDILATPPSIAAEGECYLISSPATDEWAGHDDQLAARIAGEWHFVSPRDGLTIYNVSAGNILHYKAGWQSPVEPVSATGGTTVDAEARQMLESLVEALKNAGIFANL